MRYLIILLALSNCVTYNTSLVGQEKGYKLAGLMRGESCSNNLFGGFTLPYIGSTAIKLKGEDSVIAALTSSGIRIPYAVDTYLKHYLVYSKKCTIVYGLTTPKK